jgi:hypothetical protein
VSVSDSLQAPTAHKVEQEDTQLKLNAARLHSGFREGVVCGAVKTAGEVAHVVAQASTPT